MKWRDHLFSIILFHVVSVTGAEGQVEVDSVKAILLRVEGAQKVRAYLDISTKYIFNIPDSSLHYAMLALDLSSELDDQESLADSYQTLGQVAFSTSQYDQAKHYYEKHFHHARLLEDSVRMAMAWHGLGNVNLDIGNYDSAAHFYFKALKAFQGRSQTAELSKVLNNLGLIHYYQEEYRYALSYFLQDLENCTFLNDTSGICFSLGNIGGVYLAEKNYDSALHYFFSALEMGRELSDKTAESYYLGNIGSVYAEQGKFDQALMYLFEALPIVREIGDQGAITDQLNYLAEAHHNLGRYSEALGYYHEALEIAIQTGLKPRIQYIYEGLSRTYEKSGQPEESLKNFKKSVAIKDSLFSETKARQIAELQTEYKTQQKEQEIATLQMQKEKEEVKRDAFAFGLLLTALIGFMIYNGLRLKMRKNAQIREHEKKIELSRRKLAEADLKNVKLQQRQLEQELVFKRRQLHAYLKNLKNKNTLVKSLQKELEELKHNTVCGQEGNLDQITQLVSSTLLTEEDWKEFKLIFEEVHYGFFAKLKEKYSDLTEGEIRLFALMKLSLSSREISHMLGISKSSVNTARYRLRKKLDITSDEKLEEYVSEL